MQSFGDLLANNRLLAAGILLAAIAIILAVGVALFRLMFGRRLHMTGGRTRQPRLGVVDAFDLDRQRQLVLVRRDNVEHLLMIGGPTDVVIESAIVRAPALAARDKENGTTGTTLGIPAPMQPASPPQPAAPVIPVAPMMPDSPAPMPALEPAAQYLPADRTPEFAAPPIVEPKPEPEQEVPAAPEPASVQAETRLPPAAMLSGATRGFPTSPIQRTPSAMPPRPPLGSSPRTSAGTTSPLRPPFSRATPLPLGQSANGRAEGSSPRPTGSTANDKPSGDTTPTPAPLPAAPSEPEPVAPASPQGDPPPATGAAAPSGLAAILPAANAQPRVVTALPPRPPTSKPASTPSRAALPNLGSLEEEMAKLLGRPLPPPDQSGS